MIITWRAALPFVSGLDLETAIARRYPQLQKVRYLTPGLAPNVAGPKQLKVITQPGAEALSEAAVLGFLDTLAADRTLAVISSDKSVQEDKAMANSQFVKTPAELAAVPAVTPPVAQPVAPVVASDQPRTGKHGQVIAEGTRKLQEAMQSMAAMVQEASDHSTLIQSQLEEFRQMQDAAHKNALEQLRGEFSKTISGLDQANQVTLEAIGKLEARLVEIARTLNVVIASVKAMASSGASLVEIKLDRK